MGASVSNGGIFINGRTGAKVDADLRAIGGGLEIRDPRDNLMLALWAYADMAPIRPLKAGRPVKKLKLVCQKDPDSRLEVSDPALIALLQKANRALRPPRKPLPPWAWRGAAGLAAVILIWFFLESLTLVAGPLASSLPVSWETSVGQRLADHLIQRLGGACGASGGQAALDSLAHRFDHDAARPSPTRLRVIKTAEINAYAFPDGIVVITAGLIHDVETTDQLAAIVAHQLAHLDLHHVAQHIIEHAGLGMAFLIASTATLPFTNAALTDLQHLSYNRREEDEANALTQSLLTKADIPAQSMGSYFRLQELHEKKRGVPTDFQAAHPTSGKRQETQGVQPFSRPALNDAEWLSVRHICD
ncbi:MAG TPA: M48 family metalloprotease [Telmatospirillum sp.]|nr:M48 family metalloprotease [Telmatospirillum sp.]